MFCINCHASNIENARFCNRCGRSLETVSNKSRMTALVLGVTLGTLGAHRAYIGKYTTALIQCATFVIPLAALIALYPWQTTSLLIIQLSLIGVSLVGNAIWVIVDVSQLISGTMTDATMKRVAR